MSWTRLAIVVAAIALVWPALFADRLSAHWLWLPLAAFVLVAVVHENVERRCRRARRASEVLRRAVDRVEGDWIGHGPDGSRFIDAEHPYASDLDLFGPGSLFEFLCAARTADGEARLAGWLAHPADPRKVRDRQEAIAELRDRPGLRLDLALLGARIGSTVDTRRLVQWARSPAILRQRWPQWIAATLGIANVATFTAWLAPVFQQAVEAARGGERIDVFAGAAPFFISLVASMAFTALHGGRVRQALHDADRPQHDLELLAGVLERIQRETFDSAELRGLTEDLRVAGVVPSRAIDRLTRIVQIEESRHNAIFRALGGMVFAGTHLAYAMEHWRSRYGSAVAVWIDAVARFEALSSLARHAHENPADLFPTVDDGPVALDARGLAHPLLPIETAVRNDVALARDGTRLWVVSGSNMAGKSTLLRTTGINVALALAGAPVRATEMRLSTLQIGASMRIVDSLREGTSHLYAEIKRLHAIVELCKESRPVLFLLDEVLHGTNSSDRRAGAAAVVRSLLQAGAIGMVTTHDLALARIADELGDAGANVHFVDHMRDGKLAFDYTLRPGPVQKGNALELMRATGLEV
ncbi:MAG: DNA mismatch repair protein MutS [Acidobacteria bacterium]|nr:DNA mismatch repair protein MutS [Acidobacteriota bacterium]NIM62329.1 DNA mismatch repair protein MutS [Acidobacteriota bacterium]NIO60662.1 DNA mismatch repair protein MutS [Acidobacteriota bacterium]NIQ85095.1 DNA mismatch repair protein MutS [Acidobacteriota bacterium]NIT12306.1 DNA mismatch repair protein MutS [Acidobacteriota bacterium]